MKDQLQKLLQTVLMQMGVSDVVPEVEVPEDLSHGEYTTNVAMKLAGVLKKSPMDIALSVKEAISRQLSVVSQKKQDHNNSKKDQSLSPKSPLFSILQAIDRVEVAPPGFINFFLTEAKLSSCISQVINEAERYGKAKVSSVKYQVSSKTNEFKIMTRDTLTPDTRAKRIMVEFAHPNTHKAFHIGHLRNITTGESIVRLLEATGHKVIRANYQGDVGLHIAKALYALVKLSAVSCQLSAVRTKDSKTKVEFLGRAYAAGSKAFDESEEAKKEIGEINKLIYAKDQKVYDLYRETRQWSLDYFAQIYQRVNSHFDRLYFESEVFASGKAAVLAGVKKGVFVESDGAIIFPGEKYGLHNRVFVTSEGNPTYEGKDIGLVQLQLKEYHPDLIIHVVGPEQATYFQVIFKAMEQLLPETTGKQYHLIYGWVKLKHGKMSSRSGNVVLGEWLLDEAKKEVRKILEQSASQYNKEEPSFVPPRRDYGRARQEEIAEKAAIAAVKYAFLKVSTKSEIAFDFKESVNMEGDSGPYLLYTYARARSVVRKAQDAGVKYQVSSVKKDAGSEIMTHDTLTLDTSLNPEERSVARLLLYFPEIVAEAVSKYAPNLLCTYLFNLAQNYNLFYAKHSILGKSSSSIVHSSWSETDKNKHTLNDEPITMNPQSAFRIALTVATAQVIHNGLHLLGIETVEKM